MSLPKHSLASGGVAAPGRELAHYLRSYLRPYWLPLLVAGGGLALLLALAHWRSQQFAQEQQRRVQTELRQAAAGLKLSASATFHPVLELAALIRLDGGIDNARFDALTQRPLAQVSALRSVTVAPDDVVRLVYLSQGGSGQSRPLAQAPSTHDSVLREVREQKLPRVVAPVPLPQGGSDIVLYVPVFLPSHNSQEQHYWGMVTAGADLDTFIRLSGLQNSDREDVDLAVFMARENGLPGTLVAGDAQVAALQPLTLPVSLPGTQWVLAAVPQGGWQTLSLWDSPDLLGMLIGVLALTSVAALLAHQRQGLGRHRQTLTAALARTSATLAELERAQARVTSVAALGSDWIWEQDAALRFTFLGGVQSMPEHLNFKGALGRARWDLPSAVGPTWEAHRALLEGHQPFRDFEYTVPSPLGPRQLCVSGVPLFGAEGRFEGYRGVGRDVTEQRRNEAALLASQTELTSTNDRLQGILDAAVEVAIIATDLVGHITLFNSGAQRMLRYSAAEMLGRNPTMLHLHGELEDRADALELKLGRRVGGFELLVGVAERDGIETRVWTMVRRDGAPVAVSLTVSRVQSRQGELLGYLGVARDITAQLQAETQLRELNTLLETRVSLRTAELSAARDHLQQTQDELMRSERLATLGSLVAGVAHELNTPLGNGLTAASVLQERSREFSKSVAGGQLRRSTLDSYLDDVATGSAILLRSLNTAVDMVAHFKQVSADQASVRRRRFDLATTVNDVLTVLRPRLNRTPYKVDCDIDVAHVLDSYPGPLEQIVSNLIQNAHLHAFAGRAHGRLRITARELDAARIELIVEDDGVGMSAVVRERAFEPFFTTKLGEGGTGLGLNIVKTLATGVLGGTIELESTPGQGTRFTLRLPYVAPTPETAEERESNYPSVV